MKAFLALIFLWSSGAVITPPDSSVVTLPRSTPEAQGISSAAILDFIETADREIDAMNSFMLVRHGQVVAEGWWAPYDAATPHVLYSLSKSFTSTAVGLAVAEGKLSIHDRVIDFFPEDVPAEPSENLKSMRVHDLLRMSAGHEVEVSLGLNDVWTRAFLHHPVPYKPGTHFLYNTPATYMLSAIVQKATGQTVFDYLQPRLFEPLGFEDHSWGTSPQGVTLGGYGLNIRTEDIARFGQLYLQKGMWNGKQLIPASWVEAATARQTSNGSNPDSDWEQGYGYQFWRSRHNTYRGDGAFGQYCMVFPDQDAVVAITSGVRDMQAVMNLVWDKLLPAMSDAPLPEDPATQARLKEKLSSLAVKTVTGKADSPLAESVSGKWYDLAENDLGVAAVSIDFSGLQPVLQMQTAQGDGRIEIGFETWQKGHTFFTNGIGRALLQAADFAVGASGAWTADDTYTVKLVYYETPFYTTMNFRFDGDALTIDSEHNVAFGPTKRPTLTGRAR